jgi:hypothetical protein
MRASTLSALIDAAAEVILDAAQLDGLPLMGKLWTLRVDDDAVLLRIQAAKVNNTPVPRQPPQPKPAPKPEPRQDPPKQPPQKPGR